jgi:glutamate-1-semialdehyde aminotransferase
MREQLGRALAGLGRPAQVLGEGAVFQVVAADGPVVDYQTLAAADTAVVKRLAGRLLAGGWWYTGDKAYLSIAHTEGDVDRFAEMAAAAAAQEPR